MDWMAFYICAAYFVVLVACVLGAFNTSYNANIAQRLALFVFAAWSVWRIELVRANGWGYPHEPVFVTALILYASGTVAKTLKFGRNK